MGYKYVGIELTPAIFQELLIQFFDGKQFSRQEAISEITLYHREQGGVLGKTAYEATFKKAAQNLKKFGIENIGYGIWRLAYEKKQIEIVNSQKKTVFFQ